MKRITKLPWVHTILVVAMIILMNEFLLSTKIHATVHQAIMLHFLKKDLLSCVRGSQILWTIIVNLFLLQLHYRIAGNIDME